ncbi:flagellar motor switch protein FliN [Chelatococcus sambhunathii]|uniref:Flagellar motor switch protein FliN n=1 Tax=Chelatococcus sambhunathii TaxID=363953 RepID=A0ABU1DAZ8_9HYPH|nr:FliM/FliN family flagellar motor switch protein [Chelatococcus sambhunathii]MDR4305281.1 flagellar motor switch protein FliN [Chelatococcus sambhunathii]
MRPIDKVNLELSVVLGSTTMPVHQLLRMGRGAVIELDVHEAELVTILVNEHPVALGSVFVDGERIAVEITEMLAREEPKRTERLPGEAGAEAAA